MKVTYMAFMRLCKKYPEVYRRVVPGDTVEVADKFLDFFEEDEVVLLPGNSNDSKEMLELGKRKVAAKKQRQKEVQERIRDIQTGDDEDTSKDKKSQPEVVLPLDDNTKKLVDYKLQLQKREDLTKLEKKKKLAEFKESLEKAVPEDNSTKEDKKKTRNRKEKANSGEGKLVKDPETGEFKREE